MVIHFHSIVLVGLLLLFMSMIFFNACLLDCCCCAHLAPFGVWDLFCNGTIDLFSITLLCVLNSHPLDRCDIACFFIVDFQSQTFIDKINLPFMNIYKDFGTSLKSSYYISILWYDDNDDNRSVTFRQLRFQAIWKTRNFISIAYKLPIRKRPLLFL